MEKRVFKEIARFQPEKHVHVPVFAGERTKVLLLCLGSGQAVPPHSHAGFEVTLQPILGRALLPMPDGTEATLNSGEVYFADGAFPFNPRNPFPEPFEMLIHLVKKQ